MSLDMFFKMVWHAKTSQISSLQHFLRDLSIVLLIYLQTKDKVLIAKLRAGQKKSFDRHSTQVDLAGKNSTKSLTGKIW